MSEEPRIRSPQQIQRCTLYDLQTDLGKWSGKFRLSSLKLPRLISGGNPVCVMKDKQVLNRCPKSKQTIISLN